MENLKVPLTNYLIYFEEQFVKIQYYNPRLQLLDQYKKEQSAVIAGLKEVDYQEAVSINWAGAGLEAPPISSTLPKLIELNLDGNRIFSLDFINHLPTLHKLSLANNLIECISPIINQAESLFSLDLSFNKISDINQIKVLQKNKGLFNLVVLGNPFTTTFEKYPQIVSQLVTSLQTVDGYQTTKLAKQIEECKQTSLTVDLIEKRQDFEENGDVSSVDLSGLNIISIDFTKPFNKLTFLNISRNSLANLDGIQFLSSLRELNAENNQLVDISDIGHLVGLRRLEMGGNKINSLGHALTGLKELVLLSLEHNRLTSLAGLSELSNLLELYMGENFITNLKEVRNLSELKRLIVLDLWGNPLCSDREFRLFSIFHIKEIKVLDGCPIQKRELEEARQAYTGKLSDELLMERLRGKNSETLLSLDLSNCELRDFDDIFNNQKFPKLVELNLTSNFFTNMKCFGYLPTLRELIMVDNKLVSLDLGADQKSRIGLLGIPNIELLNLGKNKLATLDCFKAFQLPRLVVLKVYQNQIKRISGIGHLTNLRDLDLSANRLKTIDS